MDTCNKATNTLLTKPCVHLGQHNSEIIATGSATTDEFNASRTKTKFRDRAFPVAGQS